MLLIFYRHSFVCRTFFLYMLRYINSHIEGAKVNRGLREETDDDDEEEISVEMPRE